MKILVLGQLIGKQSLTFLKEHLANIKAEHAIDVTVAVADAVTGGYGLGKNHAFYLRKLGVDILVGSESLFFKRDLVEELSNINFVVRPANFTGYGNFGYGMRHCYAPNNQQLNVINLMGMMGFHRIHAGNPYHTISKILSGKKELSPFTLVTFGALASAEKQTMAYHIAGKCSAVIGYGAKALTQDADIIDHTAYITDVGRIGAPFSIGGFEPETEIQRYKSQRPQRSNEQMSSEIEMQAVVLTLNDMGQATAIDSLRKTYPIKFTANPL